MTRERTRLRARFLVGLAGAVWLLVVVLALPGVAQPAPSGSSVTPYDLPTGFVGHASDGDGRAQLGILAVVGVLALGIVMIARDAASGRTARVPPIIRDLEGRGYLALEPVEGERGDWVVRRRRLPDTSLTPDERAWYFAIFGTGLVGAVRWSRVQPPSSATRRWVGEGADDASRAP